MHISKIENYLKKRDSVKTIMATINGFAMDHCGYDLRQGATLTELIIDCIDRSGSLENNDERYIVVAKILLIAKNMLEEDFDMRDPVFTLKEWNTESGDFG